MLILPFEKFDRTYPATAAYSLDSGLPIPIPNLIKSLSPPISAEMLFNPLCPLYLFIKRKSLLERSSFHNSKFA